MSGLDDMGCPINMQQSPSQSQPRRSQPRPSKFKYTPKSSPKQDASETAGGVNKEELNNVVAQEMAELKNFVRDLKGTRQNDPGTQIKTFYRDKYRKQYMGDAPPQDLQATAAPGYYSPAPENAQTTPRKQQQQQQKSKGRTGPQDSPYGCRVPDYSVSNSSVVARQVGNSEDGKPVGWTNEIPDGWDCGYTYRYDHDSCPPTARGVPLPATFGGGGGGGKYTQVLQQQSKEDYYSQLTGRDPPQRTSEWQTWYSHKHQGNTVYGGSGRDGDRAPLAIASPGGKVVAIGTDAHGGSGKRGRSMAKDEAMSQRGGVGEFQPQRMGNEDTAERVSGWFTPSSHNKNFHDPVSTRTDPSGNLKSEHGITNLGGGKKGRNHFKEPVSGVATIQSPAKGRTGGGSIGRSPYRDAQQSSSGGKLW